MKSHSIFLLLFLISACCKKPKLLKNGLTKEVSKVTEYHIIPNSDTLDIQNFDTISITELYYNDNNQVSKRINSTLFDNQKMEIDIIYNDQNRPIQEIVKMSLDTFEVNYFYRDTLVDKTVINTTTNDGYDFKQKITYN